MKQDGHKWAGNVKDKLHVSTFKNVFDFKG